MPERSSSDATAEFPKLAAAVDAAARRAVGDDVEGSVVALTELIAALQAHVKAVTRERDELLVGLLGQVSNRVLAQRLGMSRQRIDQLAQAVEPGGRPIKRPRKGP